MFRKPYKVKTSTALKGSERKRLRNNLETSFPGLSADDLNSLVPNKGDMNQVKAMTHSGTVIMVYVSGANPSFFQVEDVVYPTVYTLWRYPNLLPVLTTSPPVLEKICNGADLMAPGVIVDDVNAPELRHYNVNKQCAVRICGSKAPVAVGLALLPKEELCSDGVKGKALTIVHSFRDTLWSSGDQSELPFVPDEEESQDVSQNLLDLHLCDRSEPSEKPEQTLDDQQLCDGNADKTVESPCKPEWTMDEILYKSFMTSLKVHAKKIAFPVLTSTFYSSFVLKACPPSLNLDIRKTSHKKLSVFLKSMHKEGLLQIKELSKGVESIVAINSDCEVVKGYRLDLVFKEHLDAEKEKSSQEDTSDVQENYKFPVVTELFVISANVKVLFEKYQLKKGDTVSSTEVKEVLKKYVKENSLQNEFDPRNVTLDPILSDCVAKRGENREVMTWEQLQEGIVSKMPHAYQIQFEGKLPVVKKGKLEPIQVAVDTRTGNKKVTLISNLETYGINPDKLAQHVQVAVAASTSVTPTQNGKGVVVLIQGNQVKYLQKMFIEMYKIPRKYLQGLDNIPGKKK